MEILEITKKFAFLLCHLYLGTLGVSIEEVKCILFRSAVPRGVVVVNIYVVNSLSNLTSVVSYKRKYVHEVPVNGLFKLAQEEVWLGELTVPTCP